MKNKVAPLLKITSDKSIYFDLSTRELFIQEFIGSFTEKAGKSYSKSNTWIAGMLGSMLIIPLLAKQLNFISFQPTCLTVFCLFGIGWFAGEFMANIFVKNSKGKQIKKFLKKKRCKKF